MFSGILPCLGHVHWIPACPTSMEVGYLDQAGSEARTKGNLVCASRGARVPPTWSVPTSNVSSPSYGIDLIPHSPVGIKKKREKMLSRWSHRLLLGPLNLWSSLRTPFPVSLV